MCQGGLSGVDERMAAREAQGGTGCCFFAHGWGKGVEAEGTASGAWGVTFGSGNAFGLRAPSGAFT